MAMRPIVFRGKIEGSEQWAGEWAYGNYVETEAGSYIYPMWNSDNLDGPYYEVDPMTVSQFTGFIDMSGRRIFEGDILEDKHSRCGKYLAVMWDDEDGAFVLENEEGVKWHTNTDLFRLPYKTYIPPFQLDLYVCGNIYGYDDLPEEYQEQQEVLI